MTRAISNLVQNSIRHNPKGCEIVIRLDYVEHGFELQIKDNGIGLSEKRLRELQNSSLQLWKVQEQRWTYAMDWG